MESAQERIESVLKRCVTVKGNAPHHSLFEAASYALFPGGKRIRPLFVLASACDLGGSVEKALIPACALELIHTYSLIHDDLPCMDDDALRRGKPSLHVAFDEGLAVLTGDYLLTRAFELIGEAPHLSCEQRLALITTLAKRSGSEGMIGGQVVDIDESKSADTAWIDGKKTGALFACALEFGAIIAEIDPSPYAPIGEAFGIAFQQHDDFVDGERKTPAISLRRVLEMCSTMPRVLKIANQFVESHA